MFNDDTPKIQPLTKTKQTSTANSKNGSRKTSTKSIGDRDERIRYRRDYADSTRKDHHSTIKRDYYIGTRKDYDSTTKQSNNGYPSYNENFGNNFNGKYWNNQYSNNYQNYNGSPYENVGDFSNNQRFWNGSNNWFTNAAQQAEFYPPNSGYYNSDNNFVATAYNNGNNFNGNVSNFQNYETNQTTTTDQNSNVDANSGRCPETNQSDINQKQSHPNKKISTASSKKKQRANLVKITKVEILKPRKSRFSDIDTETLTTQTKSEGTIVDKPKRPRKSRFSDIDTDTLATRIQSETITVDKTVDKAENNSEEKLLERDSTANKGELHVNAESCASNKCGNLTNMIATEFEELVDDNVTTLTVDEPAVHTYPKISVIPLSKLIRNELFELTEDNLKLVNHFPASALTISPTNGKHIVRPTLVQRKRNTSTGSNSSNNTETIGEIIGDKIVSMNKEGIKFIINSSNTKYDEALKIEARKRLHEEIRKQLKSMNLETPKDTICTEFVPDEIVDAIHIPDVVLDEIRKAFGIEILSAKNASLTNDAKNKDKTNVMPINSVKSKKSDEKAVQKKAKKKLDSTKKQKSSKHSISKSKATNSSKPNSIDADSAQLDTQKPKSKVKESKKANSKHSTDSKSSNSSNNENSKLEPKSTISKNDLKTSTENVNTKEPLPITTKLAAPKTKTDKSSKACSKSSTIKSSKHDNKVSTISISNPETKESKFNTSVGDEENSSIPEPKKKSNLLENGGSKEGKLHSKFNANETKTLSSKETSKKTKSKSKNPEYADQKASKTSHKKSIKVSSSHTKLATDASLSQVDQNCEQERPTSTHKDVSVKNSEQSVEQRENRSPAAYKCSNDYTQTTGVHTEVEVITIENNSEATPNENCQTSTSSKSSRPEKEPEIRVASFANEKLLPQDSHANNNIELIEVILDPNSYQFSLLNEDTVSIVEDESAVAFESIRSPVERKGKKKNTKRYPSDVIVIESDSASGTSDSSSSDSDSDTSRCSTESSQRRRKLKLKYDAENVVNSFEKLALPSLSESLKQRYQTKYADSMNTKLNFISCVCTSSEYNSQKFTKIEIAKMQSNLKSENNRIGLEFLMREIVNVVNYQKRIARQKLAEIGIHKPTENDKSDAVNEISMLKSTGITTNTKTATAVQTVKTRSAEVAKKLLNAATLQKLRQLYQNRKKMKTKKHRKHSKRYAYQNQSTTASTAKHQSANEQISNNVVCDKNAGNAENITDANIVGERNEQTNDINSINISNTETKMEVIEDEDDVVEVPLTMTNAASSNCAQSKTNCGYERNNHLKSKRLTFCGMDFASAPFAGLDSVPSLGGFLPLTALTTTQPNFPSVDLDALKQQSLIGEAVVSNLREIDLKLMELHKRKMFIEEMILKLQKEKMDADLLTMKLQNEKFVLLNTAMTTNATAVAAAHGCIENVEPIIKIEDAGIGRTQSAKITTQSEPATPTQKPVKTAPKAVTPPIPQKSTLLVSPPSTAKSRKPKKISPLKPRLVKRVNVKIGAKRRPAAAKRIRLDPIQHSDRTTDKLLPNKTLSSSQNKLNQKEKRADCASNTDGDISETLPNNKTTEKTEHSTQNSLETKEENIEQNKSITQIDVPEKEVNKSKQTINSANGDNSEKVEPQNKKKLQRAKRASSTKDDSSKAKKIGESKAFTNNANYAKMQTQNELKLEKNKTSTPNDVDKTIATSPKDNISKGKKIEESKTCTTNSISDKGQTQKETKFEKTNSSTHNNVDKKLQAQKAKIMEKIKSCTQNEVAKNEVVQKGKNLANSQESCHKNVAENVEMQQGKMLEESMTHNGDYEKTETPKEKKLEEKIEPEMKKKLEQTMKNMPEKKLQNGKAFEKTIQKDVLEKEKCLDKANSSSRPTNDAIVKQKPENGKAFEQTNQKVVHEKEKCLEKTVTSSGARNETIEKEKPQCEQSSTTEANSQSSKEPEMQTSVNNSPATTKSVNEKKKPNPKSPNQSNKNVLKRSQSIENKSPSTSPAKRKCNQNITSNLTNKISKNITDQTKSIKSNAHVDVCPYKDIQCGSFLGIESPVTQIRIHKDHVIASTEGGELLLFNMHTLKFIKQYTKHSEAITHLYLCPEKLELYTTSLDGFMKKSTLENFEREIQTVYLKEPLQSIDVSWGVAFIGSRWGNVHTYDVANNKILDSPLCSTGASIIALKTTIESGQKTLIVASKGNLIHLHDAMTGLRLRSFDVPETLNVYSLLLDVGFIFCGTQRKEIHKFDFTNGTRVAILNCGNGAISMLLYKNKYLLVGCYDGFIYVLEKDTCKQLGRFPGSGKMVLALEIAGDKIVTSAKDNTLKIIEIPQYLFDNSTPVQLL